MFMLADINLMIGIWWGLMILCGFWSLKIHSNKLVLLKKILPNFSDLASIGFFLCGF